MRFLSFAKKIGKHLSNKYCQKLVDSAKKSATDELETASKRAIQKAAEKTGDLVGNKIADKIISISKKKQQKSHKMMSCNQIRQIMKYEKKDIYLHKEDNRLLMN